jgi:hypothetical protein
VGRNIRTRATRSRKKKCNSASTCYKMPPSSGGMARSASRATLYGGKRRANELSSPCAPHTDGTMFATLLPPLGDWTHVLPMLSALTCLRVDGTPQESMLGRAIAQLAHAHRTLSTIQFPFFPCNSRPILGALLSDATLDLSSIRILRSAPLDTPLMCTAIRRLPLLTTYDGWTPRAHWIGTSSPYEQDTPLCFPGLTSLTLHWRSQEDPYLLSRLSHLTELTLLDATFEFKARYENLRRLRLPNGYIKGACKSNWLHIDEFAPHLEQVSICESKTWLFSGRATCLSRYERMPRLRHVVFHMHFSRDTVKAMNVTRAVFTHLIRSCCWREITCDAMPASFFFTRGTILSRSLSLLRWHVLDGNRPTETYQPRMQASSWSKWIPGLNTRQIVWGRV